MKIEFDPAKSEKNGRERGLPFTLVAEFDWETAIYEEDTRKRYPERRMVAVEYFGRATSFSLLFAHRGRSANHQFSEGQHAGGEGI